LDGFVIQKKTLILKGSGGAGLGDKLWALVVGLMYARISGRAIYVDWRDTAYGTGNRNYFHDLFVLTGVEVLDSLPESGSVHPPAWQGSLHCSLDQLVIADEFVWSRAGGRSRYSFDQSQPDYSADHLVMWEMDQFAEVRPHFERQWSSSETLSDEQLQATIFREHLRLCPDIVRNVESFSQDHFVWGQMIGVHVRKTRECDANRPNPEVSAFVKRAKQLVRKCPGAMIFLATDNADVERLFRQQLGADRILVYPKWLPAPGMHVHMNPGCPDPIRSVKDAVADAALLGKCDWLITAQSSAFSWLARMFSASPVHRSYVIVPPVPWDWKVRGLVRRIRQAMCSIKERWSKGRQGI
jgi:hypothetical protein